MKELININRFSLDKVLEFDPDFLKDKGDGHSHSHSYAFGFYQRTASSVLSGVSVLNVSVLSVACVIVASMSVLLRIC